MRSRDDSARLPAGRGSRRRPGTMAPMSLTKNFVGGKWVESRSTSTIPVVNPATEEVIAEVAGGAHKIAPAMLAGCPVILKPSEMTPMSTLAFADAAQDAGIPPGVFNLVNGAGATVGEALASHSGVDLISFTGSTAIGKRIAALAA